MPPAVAVVFFATLAYSAFTFVWAVLWHIVLFRAVYESFGYIDEDPNFALGLLAVVAQGAILSALFLRVNFGSGGAAARGMKFALSAGAFYWTCHVLAFAAKNDAANAPLFYLAETPYLLIQFAVFGFWLGKIYAKFYPAGRSSPGGR